MKQSKNLPQYGPAWRISEWLSIGLYAVLIFEYISLWRDPALADAERIATLTMVVVFEFVLAHSGVFMAVFPKRIALFVFVPFYGMFAYALNASVPGNSIAILYLGVVLMRMRFIFSAPSDDVKLRAVGLSFFSVFLVMACLIGFSAGADNIPKLGLDEAYLSAVDFENIRDGSGDFERSPHAAMAMGATYFTLLALLEIWINGLLKPRNRQIRDR